MENIHISAPCISTIIPELQQLQQNASKHPSSGTRGEKAASALGLDATRALRSAGLSQVSMLCSAGLVDPHCLRSCRSPKGVNDGPT